MADSFWYLVETNTGEGNGNPLQYSCLESARDGEPGGLQSMGSQRVGHDWATHTHTHTQKPTQDFKAIILQLKINKFKEMWGKNAFKHLSQVGLLCNADDRTACTLTNCRHTFQTREVDSTLISAFIRSHLHSVDWSLRLNNRPEPWCIASIGTVGSSQVSFDLSIQYKAFRVLYLFICSNLFTVYLNMLWVQTGI